MAAVPPAAALERPAQPRGAGSKQDNALLVHAHPVCGASILGACIYPSCNCCLVSTWVTRIYESHCSSASRVSVDPVHIPVGRRRQCKRCKCAAWGRPPATGRDWADPVGERKEQQAVVIPMGGTTEKFGVPAGGADERKR